MMREFFNKVEEDGIVLIRIDGHTTYERAFQQAEIDTWPLTHAHMRYAISHLLTDLVRKTFSRYKGIPSLTVLSSWELPSKFGEFSNIGKVTVKIEDTELFTFTLSQAVFSDGSTKWWIAGPLAIGIAASGIYDFGHSIHERNSYTVSYEEKIDNSVCATNAKLSFDSSEYVKGLFGKLPEISVPKNREEAIAWSSQPAQEEICLLQALLSHKATGTEPIPIDGLWGPLTYDQFKRYHYTVGGGLSDQEVLERLVQDVRRHGGVYYGVLQGLKRSEMR